MNGTTIRKPAAGDVYRMRITTTDGVEGMHAVTVDYVKRLTDGSYRLGAQRPGPSLPDACERVEWIVTADGSEDARTDGLEARRAALFAQATDAVLFQGVESLERKADRGADLTADENLTRRWMLEEIERRHPETDAAMDAWAASDAPAATYTATLKVACGVCARPVVISDRAAYARGRIGGNDPRELARCLSVDQLRKIARSCGEGTSEGDAARDELAELEGRVSAVQDAVREGVRSARAERVNRITMLADRYPGRVHLIGCGTAVAIPACDVKVGDVLVYNYGATSTVTEVEGKGRGSVVIRTGGEQWDVRTCRRTTLVAITDRPDANIGE
jgi:hypothetical protein